MFGVDAVKPTDWPDGTVFVGAEIDEELQTALLKYEYEGELFVYHISSHYTTSSWGVDTENKITDSYYMELEKAKIEIKEYEKPSSKTKCYSAKYSYCGLDYFLNGSIKKEEFEVLIKNLRFF